MAIGDDAVAAGIDLTPGTGQASDIDMYINRLADEVARRTKFTSASTAAAIRTALGISGVNTPTDTSNVQADLNYLSNAKLTRTLDQYNADFADRDTRINQARDTANSALSTANGKRNYDDGYFPGDLNAKNVYVRESFAATSGWTVAYINSDNRISKGASSERYKKWISDLDPEALGDLFPQLVRYQMRSQPGSPTDNAWHVGYIAERLAENVDQQPFVVYAEVDGETVPDSIDFIALLMAQVAQLNARLSALEARADT